MVIELRNIHFAYPSYPDKDVLSDLNCLLRPGERVGVIQSVVDNAQRYLAFARRILTGNSPYLNGDLFHTQGSDAAGISDWFSSSPKTSFSKRVYSMMLHLA